MSHATPAPSHGLRGKLVLELLVVVLGITISFWLQEWRDQREDRKQETRLLRGLVAELRVDRAELLKRRTRIEQDIASVRRLLQPDTAALSERELDAAMDVALGYVSFAPSRSTYLELQQLGGSRLLRDKLLLHQIIALYDRIYPIATEWDAVNRSFVLERLFPYLDAHGPSFQVEMSGASASGYHEAFRALAPQNEFRNLLRSATVFREGQLASYQLLVAAVDKVLEGMGAGG